MRFPAAEWHERGDSGSNCRVRAGGVGVTGWWAEAPVFRIAADQLDQLSMGQRFRQEGVRTAGIRSFDAGQVFDLTENDAQGFLKYRLLPDIFEDVHPVDVR